MGDIEVDGKTLGQLAFEAYRETVRVAFNGDLIPEWDRLDNAGPAQRGWEAAARAVAERIEMRQAADRWKRPDEGKPRDFRDRPSRWRPLSVPQTAGPDVLEGDGAGTPLPPVTEGAAAQARGSVPVEVDDDTRDEAQ